MRGSDEGRGRLGVYADNVYWVVEESGERRISADRAFLLFVCEVGRRFDRLLMFGRTVHSQTDADYILPRGVELAELPHYSNLSHLDEVLKGATGTVKAMWRGLSDVDRVWIFGPHPFAVLLVCLAVMRRKPVALGVRMDAVSYYRSRLPSRRWTPALLPIWVLDLVYRSLGRIYRTTVVGSEIARHYGGGDRPSLLAMTVSLVRADDLASNDNERDWTGPIELLTVGRLEPEKNPLMLVDVLAHLDRESPGRFRLTWIGRGKLESAIREHAAARGVADLIDIRGYVPFGPELLDLYRRSHIFVLVSLTEGVPQVLIEALASGTVVVATDVGGVRAALADGRAGLLVAPRDVDGFAKAVQSVVDDDALRATLVRQGLDVAGQATLEAEAERVARFLARGRGPADVTPGEP
jgi:glycosyltransferase involved in cell wall biosynthesis